MAMTKNILFVCADRSGSNVMKAILNQHPDIYVVPALPLFEQMFALMDVYGDLGVDANWHEFLADLVELTNANHHPLPKAFTFDEVERATRSGPRTLGAAVQTIYDLLVEFKQRPVGGIKFGAQLHQVEPFVIQTRFTHIIFQRRDPRDVALSAFKSGFNHKAPEKFVTHWLKWHRNIRRVAGLLGLPLLEVRYEDLLIDPDATLAGVWKFLDLPPCAGALNFYQDEEQKQAAAVSHMWANTSKPLMRDNFEKYYREWNWRDVKRVEKHLAGGLAEFGYPRARLWKFGSWFKKRPEVKVATKEDREFHAAQEAVVARIRAKRGATAAAAPRVEARAA